jgi:SAM-dependent MidA family methyltransferase
LAAGELRRRLVDHIATHGPIGFDEFEANALYAPGLGFYTGGGGAGRRRDFLTSPEVGPLFGAVVARALDTWWDQAGRPSRFPVVEAGAGPGTLARAVARASPRCGGALELHLVERAEVQWRTHPTGVTSHAELPAPGELGDGPVVVLANELLDNLPVSLVERSAHGWVEVVVEAQGDRLVEGRRALVADQQQWCAQMAPDAVVGARIPVQAEAAAWVVEARALAARGRLVVIDYARTTAEMASLEVAQWLRTYAGHGRGGDPLEAPGTVDITCDVAVDQLARVATPDHISTQARFLRGHGIDELVAEGARTWERLGIDGGVEALEGRSRASEADALVDPEGLGSFTVLEWTA